MLDESDMTRYGDDKKFWRCIKNTITSSILYDNKGFTTGITMIAYKDEMKYEAMFKAYATVIIARRSMKNIRSGNPIEDCKWDVPQITSGKKSEGDPP